MTNQDTTPRDRPPSDGLSRRTLLSGVAALGLGAVAAGCPSAPALSGGAGAASPPGGDASAGPLRRSAELRAEFENAARKMLVPGAAMVLTTPGGELAAKYGYRDLAKTQPITLDDHFRIGSVTKTFTGTVILQLAQERQLSIDDPISRYRPDVPNGENITLSELLDMRSGLYNYAESLELNRTLDDDPTKVWSQEELLALGYKYPVYFAPGRGYHYSNTNTILLGLVAETVEQRPLASCFHARLFGPLGLRQTEFPGPGTSAIPVPHPRGYMYGTNVSTIKTAVLPEVERAEANAGRLKPRDVTGDNESWGWAAGSATSTVHDLATWVTALGDGTLLNPVWQRRRLDSVQSTNPASAEAAGYGLAIAKFGSLYGHTGEIPGWQAFTGYDPDRKLALVVLTNLGSSPDGRPTASTIGQQLIGKIYG